MSQLIIKCPFCSPTVQAACFAESENFRAIYNIAPILPGHSLVIPKKHISSFMEIPDNLMTEMIIFSRKIIRVLNQAFGTNSYDWTLQEGIPAGQIIEHMHLHIIPRKTDDLPQPGDWYPLLKQKEDAMIDSFKREKYSKDEMQKIVKKLNMYFFDSQNPQ